MYEDMIDKLEKEGAVVIKPKKQIGFIVND
jgi:hypothetical protein